MLKTNYIWHIMKLSLLAFFGKCSYFFVRFVLPILFIVQTSLGCKRLLQLCSSKNNRVDWPSGESIQKQTNTQTLASCRLEASNDVCVCVCVCVGRGYIACVLFFLPSLLQAWYLKPQLEPFVICTQPQRYSLCAPSELCSICSQLVLKRKYLFHM